MRDPHGIRPGYYFEDDEVFAVASERAPLMTVFNKGMDEISRNEAGRHSCGPSGWFSLIKEQFSENLPEKTAGCSFERIYFSRGNDPDIYAERKTLGALLVPQVVEFSGKGFF
jgi:amidophosphoribosyltransferase